MEEIKVTGKRKDGEIFRVGNTKGDGFDVMEYDGVYLYPLPDSLLNGASMVDLMKDLKNANLDKDDVLICAFPKCGTHWTWEMVEMLKSEKLEHQKEAKETRMLEFIFREKAEAVPVPRCLNTHLPLRMCPTDVELKKIKVIHVIRNPKDVCVSYFNHLSKAKEGSFDGSFADFTDVFIKGDVYFGAYQDYLLTFEKESRQLPGITSLTLYYENTKKDPVGTVKQLSKFLDLSVTDEFCQEVAEACSFKSMKQSDLERKREELFDYWKEGSGGTFYRKGEIGDWKNWFTVAESERFDLLWNESMKDSDIKCCYS